LSEAANHEARDDRYVASVNLNGDPSMDPEDVKRPKAGQFNLAYLVRAVTPGSFTLPAPIAEDMYRFDVNARGEVGKTIIAPSR